MKLLVTGANGQLGQEIKQVASTTKNVQFVLCSRVQLDITDAKQLTDFVVQNEITAIISCSDMDPLIYIISWYHIFYITSR